MPSKGFLVPNCHSEYVFLPLLLAWGIPPLPPIFFSFLPYDSPAPLRASPLWPSQCVSFPRDACWDSNIQESSAYVQFSGMTQEGL